MTTMEVPPLPGWVIPARSEVSDLQWLAYRLWRFENSGAFPTAVHATTKWVLGWGEERGPATGVEGQPVTQDMAHEELGAAVRVSEMALQSAGRDFLVHWTYGVRHTLSWLLGVHGAKPPYRIPIRHPEPDWSTLSAQELYDREIATDPERYPGAAQRWQLWQQCECDAQNSANLAVLIDRTLHQVAAVAQDGEG